MSDIPEESTVLLRVTTREYSLIKDVLQSVAAGYAFKQSLSDNVYIPSSDTILVAKGLVDEVLKVETEDEVWFSQNVPKDILDRFVTITAIRGETRVEYCGRVTDIDKITKDEQDRYTITIGNEHKVSDLSYHSVIQLFYGKPIVHRVEA